jgi:isoleucyl-tRNA synthetase
VTITSAARVHTVLEAPDNAVPADPGTGPIEGVWLCVSRSTATKCVRCWHLRVDVGSDLAHPELCGRCVGNISGHPESRRYA